MPVSEVILQHVYQSMSGLAEGEAGRKALELAEHYGVTRQTIFRYAAIKGLRWRKEKNTKGSTRVSEDTLKAAGALLLASRRTSNEIPLPACDAKEMLEDSGVDTGVSTSRFLTLMREREINKDALLQPSPHQTMLSEHPNHVWQFDVTNCLQYFLDDKGMGERDADMTLYKNKIVQTAKSIKKELLRYAVVDHCTGAFFLWYYYASGERAIDGADFLYKAMRPKNEIIEQTWNGSSGSKLGKYHFHGVPFMLIPDRGSIITNKANENLLKALRIKVEPHMPGNPRAKGSIEGLMHIINRFEANLKFKRPRDLAELNAWALDWCIKFNGVNLMRGVAPRSAMWSTIRAEHLRLCPEWHIYKMLIRRPEIDKRVDGALHFALDGKTYQVPNPNAARKTVKVVIQPYEYPNVEVHFNGEVWLLQPIPKDQYGRLTQGTTFGEYKSHKYTETQKAKAEMEKIASEQWGLTWKGTGDKRRAVAPPVGAETPLQVFGHQAEKVKVEFLNRQGTELEYIKPVELTEPMQPHAVEVSRAIVDRKVPILELIKELRDVMTPALNQALRETYGQGIEKSKIEEVVSQIKAGIWNPGSSEEQKLAAAGGL